MNLLVGFGFSTETNIFIAPSPGAKSRPLCFLNISNTNGIVITMYPSRKHILIHIHDIATTTHT